MKKVKFWMDFGDERVVSKKELEERRDKRVKYLLENEYYDWEEWLNNNYDALDMFNASEEEKKAIRARYEELVKKDAWEDILDELVEIEADFEDLTIVEG